MTQEEIQKLRDLPLTPGGGLLQRLGITMSHGRFLCPAHEDKNPSATISRTGTRWKCWSCSAGGNAIDLAMLVLHKNFKEACEFLSDTEHIIISQPNYQTSPAEADSVSHFDPMRYVRFFEHPYLSAEAQHFLYDVRKLDPQVISWCRLTSWTDRNGVSWLQIPYYDMDGRLIGIQNRNLSGSSPCRFRFPSGSRCSIYNLPVLRLLKPDEECWIAEGCSDCWSLLSDHHKAIAIPSATLLKPRDKELLQQVTAQLSIQWKMAPDQDEPGLRLAAQLQSILPNLEIVTLPEGCKDYSDYYVRRIQNNG